MDCLIVSHVDFAVLQQEGRLFLPMCHMPAEKRVGERLLVRGPDPALESIPVQIESLERPAQNEMTSHISVRMVDP